MKSNVLNIKNSDYEVTLKMICFVNIYNFFKKHFLHT